MKGKNADMNRNDFTEQKAPELYQFSKRGDNVHGTLLLLDVQDIKGKQCEIAMIDDGEHTHKIILTADIRQKLKPSHIGKQVWIEFTGMDQAAGRDGNAMKVFYVGVR